jgi:hypothetical protein
MYLDSTKLLRVQSLGQINSSKSSFTDGAKKFIVVRVTKKPAMLIQSGALLGNLKCEDYSFVSRKPERVGNLN